MRPSPVRHSLAVLRIKIGCTQKRLAEMAGCSRRAIQAIELGQLKMSKRLAQRLSHETGADPEWLLQRDPAKPSRSIFAGRFIKAVYEKVRAEMVGPAIGERD